MSNCICPKCGLSCLDTLNKCPSCGSRLSVNLCPKCGFKYKGTLHYCEKCSANLEQPKRSVRQIAKDIIQMEVIRKAPRVLQFPLAFFGLFILFLPHCLGLAGIVLGSLAFGQNNLTEGLVSIGLLVLSAVGFYIWFKIKPDLT